MLIPNAVLACETNEGEQAFLQVRILVVDEATGRAVVSDGLDRWIADLRDLIVLH